MTVDHILVMVPENDGPHRFKRPHVFIRDPLLDGRWILTRRCVLDRSCPQCHAVRGEPCKAARFTSYITRPHKERG